MVSGCGLSPWHTSILLCTPAKDGRRVELCHAPIPPQYVSSTLSKNGLMTDGNFLVRESRNTDHAYTLSLWYRDKVMNYRIIYEESMGYSFQDPRSEGEEPVPSHEKFPTLVSLIEHHSEVSVSLVCMSSLQFQDLALEDAGLCVSILTVKGEGPHSNVWHGMNSSSHR